jgi:hypothetical protein
MADPCGDGNFHSSSIEGGQFLDQLSVPSASEEDFAPL